MKYKAVMFDLDGTLLNTLDDLADATNRMLARHGLPTHETEAYRYFVGNGAAKLVYRALPEAKRSEVFHQACVHEFLDDYNQHCDVKTRLYDGIPELLSALEDAGIAMAVMTNKPQHAANLCAEKYLSEWSFARILGQRAEVPVKPHPQGPREVIAELGVLPAEILYVGDTNVDMETAVNADMFPVGALWGFRPEKELVESGARALIAHPMELLNLL